MPLPIMVRGPLPVWCGTARCLSETLTPDRPGTYIFILMGNIGGWGRWGERSGAAWADAGGGRGAGGDSGESGGATGIVTAR